MLGHNFGSASGYEAWTVTTANKGDYAAYGPYATDVPLNTRLCAWFYLAVDNVVADSAGVVVIDAANRGTPMNRKYLQRQHFNAANTMQAFSVCFTTPSSSSNINIEYRAWTPGEQKACDAVALSWLAVVPASMCSCCQLRSRISCAPPCLAP